MSTLRAQWSSTPRAMRWGIMALVGIAAYFTLFEWWLGTMESLSGQARAKSAELANLSGRAGSIESSRASVLQGMSRYGAATLPGDAQTGSNALNQRLEAVLQEQGVRQYTTTARTASLGPGPLNPTGSGILLDRLMAELQFESTPETAAAVLAALESAPEVSAVSRVELRKLAGSHGERTVRVTMSAEAWVASTRGSRGAPAPVSTGGLP